MDFICRCIHAESHSRVFGGKLKAQEGCYKVQGPSCVLPNTGLEYHMRAEETANVPGNKPFVRLNCKNSSMLLLCSQNC